MKAADYIDKVKAERNALRLENERLLALCHKMKKALTCCTIIGGEGGDIENDRFFVGWADAVQKVHANIKELMEMPKGEPFFLWMDRQVDPNIQFVDGDGNEIQYPTRDRATDD